MLISKNIYIWTFISSRYSRQKRPVLTSSYSLSDLSLFPHFSQITKHMVLWYPKRERGEMGRAPCCSNVGLQKGPWTAKEDTLLINYIRAHGEGHWRSLPKKAGIYSFLSFTTWIFYSKGLLFLTLYVFFVTFIIKLSHLKHIFSI